MLVARYILFSFVKSRYSTQYYCNAWAGCLAQSYAGVYKLNAPVLRAKTGNVTNSNSIAMGARTIKVGILMESVKSDPEQTRELELLRALQRDSQAIGSEGVTVDYSILSNGGHGPDEIRRLLNEIEVLLATPSAVAPFLSTFPENVKWIQSLWAGIEPIYQAVDRKAVNDGLHYKVTVLKGCFGHYIAEYVVSAVVALERRFKTILLNQTKSKWSLPSEAPDCFRYRRLDTLTFGVLGAGDIGLTIASYLKKLGMTVYAVKRTPLTDQQRGIVDRCFTVLELDSFLSSCDYICNILPSTAATKGLLSGDRLQACSAKKPGFINVGRGDIIDELSLINALNQGWISSAFLDVFETEPLPSTSPLWTMENVTITPHVSGVTMPGDASKAFCRNLGRYIKGQPLLYNFDWVNGY